MIGKRILQLILHTVLILIFIINIPRGFDDGLNLSNIIDVIIFGCALMLLVASVKLNWQLLRLQKIAIKLPRTSLLHFGLIALSILIIDFSGKLNFYHDSHLSIYALSAELPGWLSLPERIGNDLGIVATDTGIYMFLFYVFMFTLASGMHTCGWFLNDVAVVHNIIQPYLSWFQIVLGVLFVSLVSYLNYRLCVNIFNFLADVKEDDGLLNTWNIGYFLSDSISAVILTLYATWILHDGIKLWEATRTRMSLPAH